MAAPISCRIRAWRSGGSTVGAGAGRAAGGSAGMGSTGAEGATETGAVASSRMMASTVPVGTVSPAWTRMLSITPVVKTSTSMRPLSVSTSATMSPRLMASPTRLRHAVRVPAVMSTVRMGITNSAMRSEGLPDRANDRRNLGQRRILHVLGVGHRHFGAAHPPHRRVQAVEGTFHDLGAHLGGEAARAPPLVHDDRPVRLGHRGQDGRSVEWSQRPEVEDLHRDAVGGELVGGLQRLPSAAP